MPECQTLARCAPFAVMQNDKAVQALDPEYRALAAFGFVDRRAPYGVTELPDMLHEARALPTTTGITADPRPS